MSTTVEMMTAVFSGGVLTQVVNSAFSFMRGRRTDDASLAIKAQESAAELALKAHTQLREEQKEWRDTLRADLDRTAQKLRDVEEENGKLRGELAELRVENEELREELAAMKTSNRDLKADNVRLEARVRELERDLNHDKTETVVGLT